MNEQSPTSCTLMTPNASGAIAILQLTGPDAQRITEAITGKDSPAIHKTKYVNFLDIDDGIVVQIEEDCIQLMPHGGPRVIERMIEALSDLGAFYTDTPSLANAYPEAKHKLEAMALATIAKAKSPAAIDMLLSQSELWEKTISQEDFNFEAIKINTAILSAFITPPSVALVGHANVGKSTLTNTLSGQAVAIAADMPGTTRDWIERQIQIPSPLGQLALSWADTPGLRESDDHIEQSAIQIAAKTIQNADIVISMRDHEFGHPDLSHLGLEADILLCNKIDDHPTDLMPNEIGIAARDTACIEQIAEAITAYLKLENYQTEHPAAFDNQLAEMLNQENVEKFLELL